MRNLFILLFIFILNNTAIALEQLDNVGIAKYAVLEVTKDNTPIRTKDNENAARMTHLFKDTVLFADKQSKHYYRIELGNNKYGWVSKKLVEIQAVIPEKRFNNIKKISFSEDKKFRNVKIETRTKSAHIIKENITSLDFTLFDNRFDPFITEVSNKNKHFSYDEKIANELNLAYKNEKPLFGYDIEKYKKGYILKIRKAPKINPKKPLKNITVVVDPGHGGTEKGACAFGLEEKNINLEISKALQQELKSKGARVYLTRKNDKTVPLYNRVFFAKQKNADILLSIHQNSLPNIKDIDKKHGVGTYYYNKQSKPLAQKIQENLVSATNFKDDKVNHASFVLTRPTAQVSVLVECGYIIKQDEAEKLTDKDFQQIIAQAIVKGCEEYLTENF